MSLPFSHRSLQAEPSETWSHMGIHFTPVNMTGSDEKGFSSKVPFLNRLLGPFVHSLIRSVRSFPFSGPVSYPYSSDSETRRSRCRVTTECPLQIFSEFYHHSFEAMSRCWEYGVTNSLWGTSNRGVVNMDCYRSLVRVRLSVSHAVQSCIRLIQLDISFTDGLLSWTMSMKGGSQRHNFIGFLGRTTDWISRKIYI